MIFLTIILPLLLITMLLFLFWGIKRKNNNINPQSTLLKISVVIPFKNEAERILPLLKNINEVQYPKEYYELIFVDDESTDNTSEIIHKVLRNGSFVIANTSDKKLPAKKGALEEGIKHSRFGIIAITDADCEPESGWLKSISGAISDGYDLVFGYSPLRTKKNFISKISSFENLRNYILYFAAAGLGIPYSATSRSIAFTKQAYDKLNGFRNTLDALSGDDDLFIREAVKRKLKIGTFRSENDLVYSNPSESFIEYFKRKSRHLKTSHHYLIKHQLLLGFWHLINILSLYSVILIPVSFLFVIPFITKMISDVITIQKQKKHLPHNFNWIEVIILQPIYETFLIINFFNSLLLKDRWK